MAVLILLKEMKKGQRRLFLILKRWGLLIRLMCLFGDAVEILPTFDNKYDMVFIDAAKGKYPFFLNEALRMSKVDTIIVADNVLYKGYVMSDYNKHKQRTAVRNLREYIHIALENPRLKSEILEAGDGLCYSLVR